METRSVTLRILGDDRSGRAAIDWINAGADKIDARNPSLKIGADASGAMGKMAGLRTAVDTLTSRVNDVKFGADDAKFNAGLASMLAKLTALQAVADRPILSDKMLAKSKADVLGLAATFDTLMAAHQDATESKLGGHPLLGKAAGSAAGLFHLPTAIPLFGGIATTGGLHVLIDGAIELASKLIPATVALIAFGGALGALAPTADMIYQRELNIHTATDILGQQFPMLTTKLNAFGQLVPTTSTSLSDLNDKFKPGVVQVWGDALTVASSGTGTLQKLLAQAVPWVDKFAAKLTVDLSSGGGAFMKFVEQGAHDLGQFGQLLAPIISGLSNLFKIANKTGIADDLLVILDAGAKLFDLITKLPTPILVTAIALHGMFVWGGLAVTGLSKLAGIIGSIPGLGGIKVLSDIPKMLDGIATKGLEAGNGIQFASVKGMRGLAIDAEGAEVKTGLLETSLAALSAVPVWGWVAAGALALGGLVWWLGRGKDANDQLITSLNQGIAKANNAQVFNLMANDIGKLNEQLKTATVQTHLNAAASDAASSANMRAGQGMSAVGGAAAQATGDQANLSAATVQVNTQMSNFGKNVGWIMQTFGVSYPAAIAIANQAGVKLNSNMSGNSKAAQDLRQQIFGLMGGLTQLQGPSGLAGKDFEALAISSNDTTTKISQLNSAWRSMMTTVTGPQTAFDTFAQGMTTLKATGEKFNLTLGKLKVSGIQGKAAIDDLSQSGVNLNQAFMTQVGNLDSYEGALRTTGASQAQQTAAMKAGVAALIPYAAGSKEATATLSLMAQEVNGPTTDSIKVLAQWAGVKAPSALGIMKKTADAATVAASNLANTLENLLNTQFQNDIIQSSGASAALSKYTTDLVHNQQTTRQGQSDRQNLINDLIAAGLKADRARSFVDGLSTSLSKIPKSENPFINMTGKGTFTISGMSALTGNTNTGFLPTPTGHAAGWRVPGYGGGDKWPAMLEGGEAVVPKHLVAPIAPFLSRSGVPGFAAGGFVGSGSFSGSVPGLASFGTGMFNTFQNDMTNAMVKGMRGALQSAANMAAAFTNIAGGSGVTRWAPVILEALKLLGQPAVLLAAVESRMQRESGGNATIVNKWDSNWAAGTPSVGLMQVISPTFDAYAGAFRGVGPFEYGVSVNPLANTYAGLHYAVSRYGSLFSAMMQAGGYANGGMITEPMFAMGASGRGLWLGERGPEIVTPINRPGYRGSDGSSGGNIYITVNAGDAIDPNAVAQAIHQRLRRYKQKKGNLPLGLD